MARVVRGSVDSFVANDFCAVLSEPRIATLENVHFEVGEDSFINAYVVFKRWTPCATSQLTCELSLNSDVLETLDNSLSIRLKFVLMFSLSHAAPSVVQYVVRACWRKLPIPAFHLGVVLFVKLIALNMMSLRHS